MSLRNGIGYRCRQDGNNMEAETLPARETMRPTTHSMSDSAIAHDCPSLVHEAATTRHTLMFVIALAFLILTAFSLHHFEHESNDPERGRLLGWLFIGLWIPIFAESLVGYWQRTDYSWKASGKLLLIWLIPPYRLALSTYPGGQCLWLPMLGWQRPDRVLFDRMDRGFSIPMVFIALLILPILAIEFFGAKYIPLYPELGLFLNFGTALIWLAFAFEFIMMSSVAEAKLKYIVRNWINLAIILIPLVAFLRGFQVARLLRLGKTTRALKIYRLRGLGMRAWRGVLTLELIERILHRKSETRLEHLNAQLHDKEQDLEILRERIRQLEATIASKRQSSGAGRTSDR